MRIDFRRSGGYPFLPLDFHADTDQLPEPLADELRRLVEAAGVFELRQAELPPVPPGAADYYTYEISLSEADRGQSLSITEVNAPEPLKPLLHRLADLALEQKLKSG